MCWHAHSKQSSPFESQGDAVDEVDVDRDEQSCGSFVPQRDGCERHRASDVHRIAQQVERETVDARVHEDAEVVAQECARDAEGVGGGEHEDLADEEEGCGDEGGVGLGENGRVWLVSQCTLIAYGKRG